MRNKTTIGYLVIGLSALTASLASAQEGLVEATVSPNPLSVEITSFDNNQDPGGPGTQEVPVVVVDEWFEVTANFNNNGEIPVERSSIKLNAPRGALVRNARRNTRTLEPGEGETLTWLVKIRRPGIFILNATGKGRLSRERITAADTQMISASNDSTVLDPGLLALELASPDPVQQDDRTTIQATITNTSDFPLERINVRLNAPREVRMFRRRLRLSKLNPGQSETVQWTVIPRQPGSFIMQSTVTAESPDGTIDATSSTILEVQSEN